LRVILKRKAMPEKKIAISAGHSGEDPGACYFGLVEHEVALQVVHDFQILFYKVKDLTENFELIIVPSVSLEEKVDFINSHNPLLAVEIHFNAYYDKRAHGTECLFFPTSGRGARLAYFIQKELCESLKTKDRGIKPRGDLYFLKYTKCTAVVTESLFISNEEEAKMLKSPAVITLIASAHMWGIEKYLHEEGII